MATQSTDDPLIATLPPATDYITYLTLLEYQLNPQNLPTLTKLLSEDDGTLAEEIGWDLLKLILPMLSDTPEEASRCLEIVARRGNPREVVVRVAEELEKLSDETNEEDDFEQEDDQDELPTFPGEAPRLHLGQMTLDGMPEQSRQAEEPAEDTSTTEQMDKANTSKLQVLLNMLGILHPRIKTQYPSRFLSTSLPAALSAYRHMTITNATTSAFLDMLGKLAGKKRPPLPPRTATQGDGASSTAPLPDPEAQSEVNDTGVNIPSEAERAIVFRLLDAVLLEVLDEYMSSLAGHEYTSMSWTARLREHWEPKRVIPGRQTESDMWKKAPALQERDALLAQFLSISTEMHLDTSKEIMRLVHEPEDEVQGDSHHDQESSEYPTSPAQIPVPRGGVIFLHAYRCFNETEENTTLLTITDLTKLVAHSFPLSATPQIPLPALQDSLLSLLYTQTLPALSTATAAQPSSAKYLLLLSTLTQLFTITPDATLRDATYHIATRLLHSNADATLRLRIITQTLQGSTLSTNWAEIEDEDITTGSLPAGPQIEPETGLTRSTSASIPHPIPLAPPQQLWQLKAIGVDWLKAEFAADACNTLLKPDKDRGKVSVGLNPLDVLLPCFPGMTPSEKATSGYETRGLVDLLFPRDVPTLPAPTTATREDNDHAAQAVENALGDFLAATPFYISTLNLICIILPHLHPSSPGVDALKARIHAHMQSLGNSSHFFTYLLEHIQGIASRGMGLRGGEGDEYEFLQESRADIFALEDACSRASAAWEKLGETVKAEVE